MTKYIVSIPDNIDPCPSLDIIVCAMDGEISYLCRGGIYGRHCYERYQRPCTGFGKPIQGANWCPILISEKKK